VYIKLVVLLRNYVTMMHGQQNIKNGWATIVVVGRLRVKLYCIVGFGDNIRTQNLPTFSKAQLNTKLEAMYSWTAVRSQTFEMFFRTAAVNKQS
jgi:hypothetical protein